MSLPKLLSNYSQLKYKTIKFVHHDPFQATTLFYTSDRCILACSDFVKYDSIIGHHNVTVYLKTFEELYEEYGQELVEWEILNHQQALELESKIAVD